MSVKIEIKCKDFREAPDCLGDIDEKYTMNFEDIGEGSIYWCTVCGKRAKELDKFFMEAMSLHGAAFMKNILDEVEKEHPAKKIN